MGITPFWVPIFEPIARPHLRSDFHCQPLDAGNLWFPTRIVVSPLRVSRVKRRLFGSSEESISISQVASVKISTGILWSDILIESTGGTDPIASHGHRKADAVRIRDLVETFQAARR